MARRHVTPPLVSVITVVKNGERYLGEALGSIMAQTLLPQEIIVVDGQSIDRTAQIARSFSQVRYLVQENRGLANARNMGIEAAQGDLIAFLDHDDLWAVEKLYVQVGYMMEHPTLQYTTTQMKFIMEAGVAWRPELDATGLEAARDGSTPSALVARKGLFAVIGGFDPAYTIGCDADWFTRARDYSIPTALLPQVLLHKRIHYTNLSVHAELNRREMFLIAKQSIARQRRLQNHENPAYSR